MNHQVSKLENPERLRELSPSETLKKIGLGENDILCDIGAGTGTFAIPAAEITGNCVYALDINDEFLGIIKDKANKEKLANVRAIKVAADRYSYDIEANTADFATLVTVLHEIENKDALLAEIKRIVKSTGKLAVIEFHKRITPMGPPVPHRIGKDEVAGVCGRHGFVRSDEFDLGDNLFCIVFNSRH